MKITEIVTLYKIMILNAHFSRTKCSSKCAFSTKIHVTSTTTACISDFSFAVSLSISQFKSIDIKRLINYWAQSSCPNIPCESCPIVSTNSGIPPGLIKCQAQIAVSKLIKRN